MQMKNKYVKLNSAFTLIELLVVISIIALLMAILMPALSQARQMAKTLVCESNIRGLNVAWHTYASDNDSKIPGANVYNPKEQEWIQTNKWDWAWAPWNSEGQRGGGAIIDSPTIEHRKEGIRLGSLFPYTESVDLYHCPSDKSGNFRTYSIPDSLNGTLDWGWTHLERTVQISSPSTSYNFVGEYDGRNFNRGSWALGPYKQRWQDQTWHDPISVWHRGRTNFGYVDGHVETRKLSDETVEAFERLRAHPGTFTPVTDEGKADMKYMHDGWPEP
ncbi:type II secretion system protein G [Sedimentisphaera salicampi]|nr:type II secretion system protein G [Sedimentisphaera salicampi]